MAKAPTDIQFKVPPPKFKTYSELIRLSFVLFFDCFPFISKVVLIIYLPIELIIALLPESCASARPHLNSLAEFVFSTLIIPTIIFGIAHYLKNKKFPAVLDAYRFGYEKWAVIFASTFKAGFISLFGLILFILPGVVAVISYTFIPFILCFDSKSPITSRQRSREISIGHRRFIFFSLIFIFLITFFSCGIPVTFIRHEIHSHEFNSLMPFFDALENCGAAILSQIFLISNLLIYLKISKEPKKEELWYMTWAP